MATMREYDDDSAIVRWRQCDSHIALSSSYCRTVVIVLSRSRILVIVFSHSRHRILALSSSYSRIVAIVLSRSRILALWILMCNHDGPNGIS